MNLKFFPGIFQPQDAHRFERYRFGVQMAIFGRRLQVKTTDGR
jgi:hypothetical protein